MQHFPSSPPSRRISLSSEGPLSLQWDEQDSFQSYSEAVFPSPPEVACSSQPIQPIPDLSLDQHSSLEDSSSSLSNEVFTDDVAPSPFLLLGAPKKKKPKNKHHRPRLFARSKPGRPITRSTTEEELSNQETKSYQLRPRGLSLRNPDFVYDF